MSTNLTRKDVIIQKYNALTVFCQTQFQISPFPPIDEIDICDMLFYFTSLFSPYYQRHDDYLDQIDMVASQYNVKLPPHFRDFKTQIGVLIDDFLSFLKSQK
jgi:hypothetical protein